MVESFILAGARTGNGKFLGGLSSLTAPQLGALVTKEVLVRCGANPHEVDEVIFGEVLQAGVGQNPARQAALGAGLPGSITAWTVNQVCGSGLKAAMLADLSIRAGESSLVIAGGMESMSRAPFLLENTRTGWKYGNQEAADAMIRDGLWCAFNHCHMGALADETGKERGISRADQDAFAIRSHQRAAQAWDKGLFAQEVIAVSPGGKYPVMQSDENIRRDSNKDALAKLSSTFLKGGSVTAGNASPLSDGAAAVVVGSKAAADKLGVKPLGRIVAHATAGTAPKDIFLAPIYAVRKVLEKARLSISDIDLFELNEAFAAQMLACSRELGLDEEKVNVHGGSIALGHPIGASGARVLVTLLYAMESRKVRTGLASLCLGGGNAVAMILQRD
ncbi:MAG: acetyl-CoA C-acetyltransferase [Gemmataceae bacterium]|nr:acetyl-CoA C-acetyltransferase [Gemmataceae bacterium]